MFDHKLVSLITQPRHVTHSPGSSYSHPVPGSRPLSPLFQILNQKIEVAAKSRIGSLDNVKHKAGGGDKKVFNDVEYLRQTSASHSNYASRSGSRRQSASHVSQS